jgi:hypothetical protein
LSYRLFAVAAASVLALQGCAKIMPQQAVSTDSLNDGIAKTCTFTPVQPTAGATVESTITMTNDGWCAFRASEKSGQAYVLGLVKQRPEHGEMLIRQWNGETRAEYTPVPSFVGTDRFTVAFRASGAATDALVKVAVTVTRGEGVAAVAAPAADEAKPSATTTRRRTTTKKKTR